MNPVQGKRCRPVVKKAMYGCRGRWEARTVVVVVVGGRRYLRQ